MVADDQLRSKLSALRNLLVVGSIRSSAGAEHLTHAIVVLVTVQSPLLASKWDPSEIKREFLEDMTSVLGSPNCPASLKEFIPNAGTIQTERPDAANLLAQLFRDLIVIRVPLYSSPLLEKCLSYLRHFLIQNSSHANLSPREVKDSMVVHRDFTEAVESCTRSASFPEHCSLSRFSYHIGSLLEGMLGRVVADRAPGELLKAFGDLVASCAVINAQRSGGIANALVLRQFARWASDSVRAVTFRRPDLDPETLSVLEQGIELSCCEMEDLLHSMWPRQRDGWTSTAGDCSEHGQGEIRAHQKLILTHFSILRRLDLLTGPTEYWRSLSCCLICFTSLPYHWGFCGHNVCRECARYAGRVRLAGIEDMCPLHGSMRPQGPRKELVHTAIRAFYLDEDTAGLDVQLFVIGALEQKLGIPMRFMFDLFVSRGSQAGEIISKLVSGRFEWVSDMVAGERQSQDNAAWVHPAPEDKEPSSATVAHRYDIEAWYGSRTIFECQQGTFRTVPSQDRMRHLERAGSQCEGPLVRHKTLPSMPLHKAKQLLRRLSRRHTSIASLDARYTRETAGVLTDARRSKSKPLFDVGERERKRLWPEAQEIKPDVIMTLGADQSTVTLKAYACTNAPTQWDIGGNRGCSWSPTHQSNLTMAQECSDRSEFQAADAVKAVCKKSNTRQIHGGRLVVHQSGADANLSSLAHRLVASLFYLEVDKNLYPSLDGYHRCRGESRVHHEATAAQLTEPQATSSVAYRMRSKA
ncbi:hypothetical protein ANO11243_068010 [Dothideomycetidae sp. 11243]|nr:hypothetical protein ANO11243_068010 [fungal sp. No.11243]